jgi:hypothetical protein
MADGGVLFRAIPQEIRDGDLILAPLFALMGGSEQHRPILLRLVDRHGSGAFEVLREVLLAKFAKLWVSLVFDKGLILEAHGQDLLLALSPDLMPLGEFYYRDFEGLAVDWALRGARRRPAALPNAYDWFSTYETWGFLRYQLVSTKLMVSLFDYVHLVLAELESAVVEWQESGAMREGKVVEGELTLMFSQHLRRAIQDKYGMKEEEEYDIRLCLMRFVKFLMRVRREVMRGFGGGD